MDSLGSLPAPGVFQFLPANFSHNHTPYMVNFWPGLPLHYLGIL